MLRELSAIVGLMAVGALALPSCEAGCDDCCGDNECSGGGSVSACSATGCGCGGSACGSHCPIDSPPAICESGASAPCVTAKDPAAPSCAQGHHTCSTDRNGFGVCDDVRPHPDACDQPSRFTCDGDAPACGAPQWATMLGGPGADGVIALAVDADDTIRVALQTDGGEVRFGNTKKKVPSGIVIVDLDATGVPKWETVLASAKSAELRLDHSHHLFVTGMFAGGPLVIDGDKAHELTVASGAGAFALALDAKGKSLWSVSLSGSGPNTPGRMEPAAIEITPSGKVLIAGAYSGGDVAVLGEMLQTSNGRDAFVAILDPARGDLVSARGLVVPGNDTIRAITTLAGDVVIGGGTDGTLQCPDPRLLYEAISETSDSVAWKRNPGTSVEITALGGDDAGIVATGTAGLFTSFGNAVSTPGFVFATKGKDIAWTLPLGWSGTGISLDEQGQIAVCGTDPFFRFAAIAKFDRDANRFYEHLYEVKPGTDGITPTIHFDAIGHTKARGLIVAGTIGGQTDLGLGFGGLPIASSGKTDGFVASFAP